MEKITEKAFTLKVVLKANMTTVNFGFDKPEEIPDVSKLGMFVIAKQILEDQINAMLKRKEKPNDQ